MADDKLLETLNTIAELEEPTQSDIVDEIGKSRSTISRRVSKLENKNWINRKSAGRTKIIELTKTGYQIAELSSENTTPTTQQRNSDNSERTAGDIRLHKIGVAFGIHDSPITDGWEKKIIESEDLRFRELEGDNSLVYSEDYTVRFTPRKAIFLVNEIVGDDAEQVADVSIDRAQSHRDDIQNRLPFRLTTEPINMRVQVSEREFSIIQHPFSKAVIENSPLRADDIQFFQEDDNHELWIDNSNNQKELETGKGASFDEEDINLLKEDLEHKVKNPEQTKRRREITEEVDNLEEVQEENSDKIKDLEKATRVLLSRELRRSREEKEKTQDATIRTERVPKCKPSRSRRNNETNMRRERNNSESKESPLNQIKSGIKRGIKKNFSKLLEYSSLLSYLSGNQPSQRESSHPARS